MPQFLVAPEAVDCATASAVVVGGEVKHLLGALRGQVGDRVLLCDGQGRRWQGVCAAADAAEVRVEQLQPLPDNEPRLQLQLLQALPKGERWETILEKGTELGAVSFQPLHTERSVPRTPPARLQKKLLRWQEKLRAAVKQCERAVVPQLHPPLDLGQTLAQLPPPAAAERRLYLAERAAVPDLFGALRQQLPTRVRLAVGPEGGWSPAELDALEGAGFQAASLGPRILRSETAAVVGMALVLCAGGDLVSGNGRW